MKRLIFTLFAALSFIAAKAYNGSSLLTLTMYDNAPFTLTFDNSYFNTPSNNFNITNVIPGNHFIKVVKMSPNAFGQCAYPVLVYNGYVNITAGSKVDAIVSGINQLTMNIQPLYTGSYGSSNYGNNGYNNYNPGYGSQCGTPVPGSYPTYMSGNEFNDLKREVDKQSFDSSKLTVARQAAASNRLASWQVAELMELMDFESTKLDLAKYAYHHVVDPQSYYTVNDSFTFSSSISELDKYITNN
jgi:hypothetical protein